MNLTHKHLTEAGIEFLVGRKGGASTLVEWTDELRMVIEQWKALPGKIASFYVIHSQAGTRYTSGGFKGIWQELMAEWVKSGTWQDDTPRAPGERFTFHDSRAKAVSDVITQGRRASELTGHRLEATVAKVYDRRRVRVSKAVR